MVDLLERFVVAVEKIAEQKQIKEGCCKDIVVVKAGQDLEKHDPVVIKNEINDIQRDYEGISRQPDGRDILLKFCSDKGIDVSAGTRTKTLVKILNEYDSKSKEEDNIIQEKIKQNQEKYKTEEETPLVDQEILSEVDTTPGQTEVTLEKGNLEDIFTEPEPEKKDDWFEEWPED